MTEKKQHILFEKSIDTKWPKNHRMKKTKLKGSEDFHSEDHSFEGIMKTVKNLGRDTLIVLYSGGKDSGKVLDILDKQKQIYAVLHLNTNTGVRQTREFVESECQRRGVKLFVRSPTPLAFAYVAYSMEFGFVGPRMHSAIMKILKYNTMKKFIQEPQFLKKNPILIGGIRKFESKERMGNYNAPITRENDLWFANPIFYETDQEVYQYFIENNLKRSPAYETLGFSGECMCGAFAEHDEAKRLEQTDPDRLDFFRWIEEGIRRWGTPEAKKYGKWGRGSYGANDAVDQEILAKFFDEDEMNIAKRLESLTCGSECGSGTMKGMNDIG